ncbi:YicC family protein [Cytobacillus spongiae]|uniref:YicC/YloC family endoribonuclease n=1 Tax=Cytobacillus spongiae TaxID=2901381 RepID=UPI001F3F5EE0|nr:YicC/YloC family endoribonuclease [Cytobacillus spongiae]UII57861.1 YicC family protein [Cytobacillus spongiae]
MVVSMTGFGRGKAESVHHTVFVEVKTVNHRFAEYHIRVPRQLMKMEEKMKKKLHSYIQRGRVEVFVTIEGEGLIKRKVTVDWGLLDQYYQYINKIQSRYSLDSTLTIHDFITKDELLVIEEENAEDEELESLVLAALETAGIQLIEMRQTEGAELAKDMQNHLSNVEQRTKQLVELAPLVVKQYEERLTTRMKEYLDGQVNEDRILAEVAIFTDKADINEELTRLNSHCMQFKQTLTLDVPIGRKLDFLLQEMNREVNTIGSKANDASIAREVVELKSLLEKLKEQVQNIE